MNDSVLSIFHNRGSSGRIPSFAGNGLPERMRSTAFALLGLTAAAGLAIVAIFAQPGFYLLEPAPLPDEPSLTESIAEAEPVPPALGRVQAGVAVRTPAVAVEAPRGRAADIQADGESRSGGAEGSERHVAAPVAVPVTSAPAEPGGERGNGRSTGAGTPSQSPTAPPETTPVPTSTPVSSPHPEEPRPEATASSPPAPEAPAAPGNSASPAAAEHASERGIEASSGSAAQTGSGHAKGQSK